VPAELVVREVEERCRDLNGRRRVQPGRMTTMEADQRTMMPGMMRLHWNSSTVAMHRREIPQT
jgi:hypothetical protein